MMKTKIRHPIEEDFKGLLGNKKKFGREVEKKLKQEETKRMKK